MLSKERIEELLTPYIQGLTPDTLEKIASYIELIVRWNARTNLTAVRDPEQLVQRQVGESLFAASLIAADGSLLDFGSGAGFPGIPLVLAHPNLRVTLAESQGKKASFLREVVRSLGLSAQVWSGRVESMEASQRFDVVAMRAVDHSAAMLPAAQSRVAPQGRLLRYLSHSESDLMDGWMLLDSKAVPLSEGRIAVWQRSV